MGKKAVRMVAAAVSAVLAFGLVGCRGSEPEDPELTTGGTTERIDASAPKAIESKDITGFYARFYLYDEWSNDGGSGYEFSVRTTEGEPVAEERVHGLSAVPDDALLAALQQVIDEYHLAELNGRYRVTAGLPPEYQPCELHVNYASGEELTYTEDNDPSSAWEQAIYQAFADWFAAQGDASLLPEE